jgi:hypothetical protein
MDRGNGGEQAVFPGCRGGHASCPPGVTKVFRSQDGTHRRGVTCSL